MRKIMHFIFLSCLKATELIEKRFSVKLSFKEKLKLSMHKSMCKACKLYGKQSKFLDTILHEHKFDIKTDIEELKRNIKQIILND